MNGQWEDWIPIIGVGLIVVPVGLLLGYFFWINNSSDTRDMRAVLFESKPYDVRSIGLTPVESSKLRATLGREAVQVSDARTIAEVMEALSVVAEKNPPNGATRIWSTMLRVTHARRVVDVEVVCYRNEGTWLLLQSKGSSGWNLGTYQCAPLGPVLERISGHVRTDGELPQDFGNAPEIPLPAEEAK